MLEKRRILKRILFFPTRYFPSISGAEFYMQRMAEIFIQTHSVEVGVFTSNAVDFKALREPTGKTISEQNKYFFKVNDVPIVRFKVEYNKTTEDKIKELRQFSCYRSLEMEDHQTSKFLKNGPHLPFNSLVERIGNAKPDLIHTTFFPYFNLILALMLGNEFGVPTACTPFFHFSNPRYLDEHLLTLLKKFDLLIACTHLEKEKLISLLNISQTKIKVISMGVDYHYFSNDST
ncbi:MAG: glycosyltransferase, partial [Promethearchaeota archaeon]